jgi:hypothetical protein
LATEALDSELMPGVLSLGILVELLNNSLKCLDFSALLAAWHLCKIATLPLEGGAFPAEPFLLLRLL